MAGYSERELSSAENTLMTLTNRFTTVIRTAPDGRSEARRPPPLRLAARRPPARPPASLGLPPLARLPHAASPSPAPLHR
jgi:hypothetical protein